MDLYGGIGLNSNVGFSKETTYGTKPATGFKHCRLITDTLKPNPSPKFYPGMSGPGRRKKYLGFNRVAGDVVVEGAYEFALTFLLKRAMGSCLTSGNGTTTPYTHTMSMSKDLDSFSVELSRGDIPAGKCFLFTGALIDQLTLDLANEEALKITASLLAQTQASNQTPSAVVMPGDNIALYHHVAAGLTIAGTAIAVGVKNLSLTINNNLDADRFFMSKTMSQPKRKTWRDVTGQATTVFSEVALIDKFAAGTEGALTVSIVSDVPIPGVTPPAFYSLALAAAGSFLSDGHPTVNGEGEIELPLAFQCVGSETAEFGAIVVNAETTIV